MKNVFECLKCQIRKAHQDEQGDDAFYQHFIIRGPGHEISEAKEYRSGYDGQDSDNRGISIQYGKETAKAVTIQKCANTEKSYNQPQKAAEGRESISDYLSQPGVEYPFQKASYKENGHEKEGDRSQSGYHSCDKVVRRVNPREIVSSKKVPINRRIPKNINTDTLKMMRRLKSRSFA